MLYGSEFLPNHFTNHFFFLNFRDSRRFVFQKKLIKLPLKVTEKVAAAAAKFVSEQATTPEPEVKLEPPENNNDFEEVSIDGSDYKSDTSTHPSRTKAATASGSNSDEIVVFMCKACKVYFPLRSMLVQHAEKVHGSLIKKKPSLRQSMTIAKKQKPAVTIVKKLVQVNQKELEKYKPSKIVVIKPSSPVTDSTKTKKTGFVTVTKTQKAKSSTPKSKKPEIDDLGTVYFDGYCRLKSGKYVCNFCEYESFVRTTVSSHSKRKHAEAWSADIMDENASADQEGEEFEVENIESEEEDENAEEYELNVVEEEESFDSIKVCPCCPFSTNSSVAHQAHVKRRHRDFWLKSLANKVAALKSATEIKQSLPPGIRQCQHCPFQSKNRSTIYMHTVRKHGQMVSEKLEEIEEPLVEEIINPMEVGEDAGIDDSEELGEEGELQKCPYCPFETKVLSTIRSHIARRHRYKEASNRLKKSGLIAKAKASPQLYTGYACSFCTFVAATVSSINHHTTREHSGEKQPLNEVPVTEYDCDQCDFKSRNRKHMQMHIKSMHTAIANDDGMYTCPMCSYETLTNMGLQRHISIKHNKLRRDADSKMIREVYECDECEYNSPNLKLLEWHKRQHITSGDAENNANTFFCNDCDFSTWTKNQLFVHIKRKHRDSEGTKQDLDPDEHKFACDQCDYTSKSKHVMKVHVIRKHTNEYNHECEICGKKYKVKADLTNHIRFQHREQPIICDVCGKTCRNSNLLYLHQKFAHYKPDFECHICHRRMVSQANLDEHILKQHEQREDVVCEECGKTFTRQARLKIHMRIHTGVKPYTCKICFKAFARRNGLRQHLLIHTGQRPYICDICGKAFTQKTGLISHRKSHPGNHPPLPRVTIDHVLSEFLNEEEEEA